MVMELDFPLPVVSVTEAESVRNLFYQIFKFISKSIFLMSIGSRCYCFFISDIVGCFVSFFLFVLLGVINFIKHFLNLNFIFIACLFHKSSSKGYISIIQLLIYFVVNVLSGQFFQTICDFFLSIQNMLFNFPIIPIYFI